MHVQISDLPNDDVPGSARLDLSSLQQESVWLIYAYLTIFHSHSRTTLTSSFLIEGQCTYKKSSQVPSKDQNRPIYLQIVRYYIVSKKLLRTLVPVRGQGRIVANIFIGNKLFDVQIGTLLENPVPVLGFLDAKTELELLPLPPPPKKRKKMKLRLGAS
jgi:hypothetical protein